MRMLRKIAKLDRRERTLLGRGVLWVVAARLGLWLLPFRNLQRFLDRLAGMLPLAFPCSPEQAQWAVMAAASRIPGTKCLAWALAAHGLLTQAGIASDLRIGVAKTPEGGLKAHAWVECRGRSLSWGDDVNGYSRLDRAFGGDV